MTARKIPAPAMQKQAPPLPLASKPVSVGSKLSGGPVGDEAVPPLPPRRGTGLATHGNYSSNGGGGARNLMDEDAGDELEGLKGWEVLRPE